MANAERLTPPTQPDMGALNASLQGLQAMGEDRAKVHIATIDAAWKGSNGSVIATSRALNQGYKKTLDDLSAAPTKILGKDDPRIVAYDIASQTMAQGAAAPKERDMSVRVAQERVAVQRLGKDATDGNAMESLVMLARSEAVRDLEMRTPKARKARENDAR